MEGEDDDKSAKPLMDIKISRAYIEWMKRTSFTTVMRMIECHIIGLSLSPFPSDSLDGGWGGEENLHLSSLSNLTSLAT